MEKYKYCRQCDSEYYAHVEKCAQCGITLLTAKQIEELENKEKYDSVGISSEFIAVREGDKSSMYEFFNHLEEIEFPCKIISCPNCSSGKCGETFQLVVPKDLASEAERLIEEYNQKVHPELKESFELSAQGMCPACKHPVGVDTKECPDCGLLLLIDD